MTSWLRQFCIYVSDIDATIRFYETLGLEVTSRTVISDDLIEAMIENPEKGAWLQLAQSKNVKPPIDMGSALWKLYVYTDDCDGVYSRAMAAGYWSISAPMRLEQWPVTLAFISDPDGYVIQLMQRNAKPTERNAGGSIRDQTV